MDFKIGAQQTEMVMSVYAGVSLRDRVSTAELKRRIGIESVWSDDVKRYRLRWLRHVLPKGYSDWVKRTLACLLGGRCERKRKDDGVRWWRERV